MDRGEYDAHEHEYEGDDYDDDDDDDDEKYLDGDDLDAFDADHHDGNLCWLPQTWQAMDEAFPPWAEPVFKMHLESFGICHHFNHCYNLPTW